MMNRYFTATVIVLLSVVAPTMTSASTVAERTQGKILLQVEQHGEAWYVNPANELRYYLGAPSDAYQVMKSLGVGITNANLQLIPKQGQPWDGNSAVMNSVRGKIVLQVEKHGEAWYVNPTDGKRYFLGRPKAAWKLMTKFGLGISDADLDQIEIAGEYDSDHIPSSYLLDVPFTSQAPSGDWSSPYSEACEEAILVMLSHWKAGTSFSVTQVEDEIQSIVQWELANYGHHEDTAMAETANTASQYEGLKVKVSRTVTINRLKQLVSEGKPVIVPVYGKALGNPHFLNGGPDYHVVLLVGYEGTDFIVHDPGTRYGENYHYNVDIFYNAIHDLTDPESNIANGEKAIVVVQ